MSHHVIWRCRSTTDREGEEKKGKKESKQGARPRPHPHAPINQSVSQSSTHRRAGVDLGGEVDGGGAGGVVGVGHVGEEEGEGPRHPGLQQGLAAA